MKKNVTISVDTDALVEVQGVGANISGLCNEAIIKYAEKRRKEQNKPKEEPKAFINPNDDFSEKAYQDAYIVCKEAMNEAYKQAKNSVGLGWMLVSEEKRHRMIWYRYKEIVEALKNTPPLQTPPQEASPKGL